MTTRCEFCDEPVGSAHGHGPGCPYPTTLAGRMDALADGLRGLGRASLRGLPLRRLGAEPLCRCGHPKAKHGFMGHPDCTDGDGDLFCLCERFEVTS